MTSTAVVRGLLASTSEMGTEIGGDTAMHAARAFSEAAVDVASFIQCGGSNPLFVRAKEDKALEEGRRDRIRADCDRAIAELGNTAVESLMQMHDSLPSKTRDEQLASVQCEQNKNKIHKRTYDLLCATIIESDVAEACATTKDAVVELLKSGNVKSAEQFVQELMQSANLFVELQVKMQTQER